MLNTRKLLGTLAGVILAFAAPSVSAFDFSVEGAKTASATLQVAGTSLTASFAQAAVENGDQLGRYCQTQPIWPVDTCLTVVGLANSFTTAAQFDNLSVGQLLWLPLPETAEAYARLVFPAAARTDATDVADLDLTKLREQLGLPTILRDLTDTRVAVAGYLDRLKAVEAEVQDVREATLVAATSAGVARRDAEEALDAAAAAEVISTGLVGQVNDFRGNLSTLDSRSWGIGAIALMALTLVIVALLWIWRSTRLNAQKTDPALVEEWSRANASLAQIAAGKAKQAAADSVTRREFDALTERVEEVDRKATLALTKADASFNQGLPEGWGLIGNVPTKADVPLEVGGVLEIVFAKFDVTNDTCVDRLTFRFIRRAGVINSNSNQIDGLVPEDSSLGDRPYSVKHPARLLEPCRKAVIAHATGRDEKGRFVKKAA